MRIAESDCDRFGWPRIWARDSYSVFLKGRVIVSDINDQGSSETLRQIQQSGGEAAVFQADVRVEEQIRRLIIFARQRFGGMDVLVNNASARFRPSEPLEHWIDPVQTDFVGAMCSTRFAIDEMRRRGGGAIVNISSTSALGHGRKTPGGAPAYDAAKAGILRLTTMLANLGEKDGSG